MKAAMKRLLSSVAALKPDLNGTEAAFKDILQGCSVILYSLDLQGDGGKSMAQAIMRLLRLGHFLLEQANMGFIILDSGPARQHT